MSKILRKIIEIDDELCDGCGVCIPSCAEGALQIINGKAVLVKDDFCDGLGACIGECPTGALKIVEREADEFDEEAVEEQIRQMESAESDSAETLACGCSSAEVQILAPGAGETSHGKKPVSLLSNWPVKIRLVPPTAPFLKDAHLLLVADCVPAVLPGFQERLVKNRIVLTGCPKFDNADDHVAKLAEIFKKNRIKSVKIAVMEVPCCSGFHGIVEKALEIAGKEIPVESVEASPKGETVNRGTGGTS